MATIDFHYWPFGVPPPLNRSLQEAFQVQFLQAAHEKGFRAFKFGINDYGARSNNREGCILERGRTRWEIRLAEESNRVLAAYVDDFACAGLAVQHWLEGRSAKEIVGDLSGHLVTPPGAKASHTFAHSESSK
jgi:hypothetical protein